MGRLLLIAVMAVMIGAGNACAATVNNPMTEDLDAAGYSIFDVRNLDTTDIVIAKGPWVDVRAYGAIANDGKDDSVAFNDAIASVSSFGGTVLVPPGSYHWESTVIIPAGKRRVRIVSPTSGRSSNAMIKWIGALGGTMLEVENLADSPSIENLQFDANGLADICVHFNPLNDGGIRNIYMANCTFKGYQKYGLVLGAADELTSSGAQLHIGSFYNLLFQGGQNGVAYGILINAQNAEWLSFYDLSLAPGTASWHKYHMYIKSGKAVIRGLVTSRATSYPFFLNGGVVSIYDWNAEDRYLLYAPAFSSNSPIVLSDISHRGVGQGALPDDWTIYVKMGDAPIILNGILIQGSIKLPGGGARHFYASGVTFGQAGAGYILENPADYHGFLHDTTTGVIKVFGDNPTIQGFLSSNIGKPKWKLDGNGNLTLTGYATLSSSNGNVGSFTFAAASSTDVSNTSVTTDSKIVVFPTNAAAANLVGGPKSPYISAVTPGVGFTVSTGDGTAATGTETFNYLVFN